MNANKIRVGYYYKIGGVDGKARVIEKISQGYGEPRKIIAVVNWDSYYPKVVTTDSYGVWFPWDEWVAAESRREKHRQERLEQEKAKRKSEVDKLWVAVKKWVPEDVLQAYIETGKCSLEINSNLLKTAARRKG